MEASWDDIVRAYASTCQISYSMAYADVSERRVANGDREAYDWFCRVLRGERLAWNDNVSRQQRNQMNQPTIDQTARALAGVRASGTEADVNRFLCAVERHYGTAHMRDAHKLAGEIAERQHGEAFERSSERRDQ